jgi:hypothetical protein
MKISIIGDNDTCKATRMLLRQAGLAVSDTPSRANVCIWIEECSQSAPIDDNVISDFVVAQHAAPAVVSEAAARRRSSPLHHDAHIYFDSIDSPLESAIVRHVSQLSRHPIVIDRPGGNVHSDRELRITVPEAHFDQQHAVQLGILRGLLDFTGARKHAKWKQIFGLTAK